MALTKISGGIIQQPVDVGIVTATSINSSGVITATSFDGNLTGNVTGNVTGNLTGNVTGNVTGNADTASNLTGTPNITVGSVTATTGNFSGNVAVGGVLTYEDVTNVDSVGVITARDGINVTGHSELDNVNVSGISTFNNDVKLLDNDKLKFGIGEDLQIYHDGTDSWIDNTEGDLYLRTTGSGDDIIIRAKDDVLIQTQSSEGAIIARGDGQVELYYNNDIKFETTNTGAVVTGSLTATTFSGNLTGDLVGSPDLSAIDSTISDTAVDVFIYDTSKDSDGGAWRKRTQHTSWYNETLNTATRGSRREFPAVAVIVSDSSSDKVTIYDGDDPDLPMWMVISGANPRGILGWATSNITKINVTALNGILVAVTNDGGTIFKFVEDFVEIMYSSANYNITSGRTIADRNNDRAYDTVSGTASRVFVIVTYAINDVAMTVLPNAPIDDATGLPIPTIAVATDGGVSVIKDDGTVVDITHWGSSGYNETDYIEFFENDLVFCMDSVQRELFKLSIPSADLSLSVGADVVITTTTGRANAIRVSGSIVNMSTSKVTSDGITAAVGSNGIAKVLDAPNYSTTLSSGITTSYNTGYMHGDIKGAFLSDTDTTNANADTLNSVNTFDGTFATSTGWTTDSDWTISGGVASCSGADAGRFIYPTNDRWPIGSSVVVEVTVTAYTSGTLHVSYATGAATSGTNMTATGTYKFVNNVSGNDLIYFRSESFIGSIDNVKIYYAEYDRSVNNKGLIPYGTVTKSAVATGAELVSYSGFSSNNLLHQPYNSDLDPGTGDYSFMLWFKCSSTGSEQILMRRFSASSVTGGMMMRIISSSSVLQWYVRDTSSNATAINSTMALDDGIWHCVVGTRQGGNAKLYIDGELNRNSTCSASSHNPGNDANLAIGAEEIVGSPGTFQNPANLCSLALVRYSLSAPSPEQVKKMYEDEKVLFQENAKATLYGLSDAVTALAYDDDTDLLHVGTSSGRSDFQGLRRINNTTTAVTTAITAQNEFIIEQ